MTATASTDVGTGRRRGHESVGAGADRQCAHEPMDARTDRRHGPGRRAV